MEDFLAVRVALDLADQRVRLGAVEIEFEDGGAIEHFLEQQLELVRVDCQRARLAGVAVDDARHLACGAELTGGTLAGVGANESDERCGSHVNFPSEVRVRYVGARKVRPGVAR